jgi:hypothetical protein
MNFRALALAASAAAVPLTAAAQQPLNLDFERASVNGSGGAWGWSLGWSAFQGGSIATFLRDSAVVHGGRYSLRITVPDSEVAPTIQTILLQIPSGFALGHRLQLSGWLRKFQAAGSGGNSTVRPTSRNSASAAPGDACRCAVSSKVNWRRRAAAMLSIDVPDDATIHSIVIGASLDGPGSAWFDDSRSRSMAAGSPLPVDPPPPSGGTSPGWRPGRHRCSRQRTRGFRQPRGFRDHRGLGESTHGTHEFFERKRAWSSTWCVRECVSSGSRPTSSQRAHQSLRGRW